MSKKVNINKDKDKYHFDEKFGGFVSSDEFPFDSKIHPNLRHLHKNASFLRCSKCKRITYSGSLHDECNMTQPNGEKCNGLMMGNTGFRR